MQDRSRLRRLLAKPWLLPDKVLAFALDKLTRRITLSTNSFGWLQAILYSYRVDQWQRYASVAQQVKALHKQPLSILDVGGGSDVIKEFLKPGRYRLCILDIRVRSLASVGDPRVGVVVGDGCRLPFKNDSFDVVTSVDSLEHIPDSKKADYCRELKRVASKCVIIHCPADSSDGSFQGTIYDSRLLQEYRHRLKRDALSTTVEHLKSGLPKVEWLRQLFPGATIVGKQNGEIWLSYIVWAYTPYIRFIMGLLYKAILSSKDDLPPYHSQLLVWRKE